jgi:thioredoxin-related protein
MRLLIIFLTLLFCVAHAAEEGELAAGGVNPGFHVKPAWFKQSFLDLGDDVAEAAEAGKRVMIFFHQDGCPYCAKLLQDNFGQRDIAEKTRQHFDVLEINMWGDRTVTTLPGESMSEKDFAAALKVMYTPTVVFLDEAGNTALRLNGYYFPAKFSAALDYASGKAGTGLSFREYLQQVAPEKASGKLHHEPWSMKPPYQLSRKETKAERPLLVLFEQKQCRICDELHNDILQREGVRALIDMFDVVQLDMWSDTPLVTPEGKRTTAKEWAGQLNVQYAPSMVYFDTEGKEVFRSEAYLKSFHVQTVMNYVALEAYKEYPSFQRFAQARADQIEAEGGHVDMWK